MQSPIHSLRLRNYVLAMAEINPPAAERPPTGDVTLLYTDIEGSTALAMAVGDNEWNAIQTQHHALVRGVLEAEDGYEQTEEGDGFLFLFSDTSAAVRGALTLQREMMKSTLGDRVRLRIGLHCGKVTALPRNGISGHVTSQASRIADAAQGEQIVATAEVMERVAGSPELRDQFENWGRYLVENFEKPIELFVWASPAAARLPLRVRALAADATPSYVTPLVGRAETLQDLGDVFEAKTGSVVTLTGTGGVGKTRLAAEFSSHWSARTSFVDLSSANSTATMLTAMVEALGIRAEPDADLETLIVTELQIRPRLVVLDNFEQVLVAVPTLQKIVDGCAASQWLITSRIPLMLRQELMIEIDPLPAERALKLFGELIGDGFEAKFDPDEIRQLCDVLDGLPLALELAAARAQKLGLANIYAQLREPLEMLHQRPNQGARHSSMEAAIQWSYDLLSPDEQLLLQSLAALDGSSTAPNLATITGLSTSDLLNALDALVHHGLVVRAAGPTKAAPRFSMLQLIRAFGREALVRSGAADSTYQNIEALYVQIARRAETALIGPDRSEVQSELDAEIDNIRTVLGWAKSGKRAPASGLKIAASLVTYWWHGHLVEGLGWLQELSATTHDISPGLRSRGLIRAGLLATSCGMAEEALMLLDSGVTLARTAGDRAKPTLSHGLQLLALVRSARGDGCAALDLANEGLDLDIDIDRGAEAVFFTNFADVLAAEDNDDHAQDLYQASIDRFASFGDEWLQAAPVGRLGELALRAGDAARARELLAESVGMWRRAGGRAGMPRALAALSRTLLAEDVSAAAAVGCESYDLARDLGAPGEAHWSFCSAALLLDRQLADPTASAELLGAALAMGRTFGQPIHHHVGRELIDLTTDIEHRLGTDVYQDHLYAGMSLKPTAALGLGGRAWARLSEALM